MGKSFKGRIAFEVLIILGALMLFCLITRLWPLVFLVVPFILIAALRTLFLSAKKETATQAPTPMPAAPPHTDTEDGVVRIAFGVLQRRVTEQVTSRHPSARWVWEASDTIGRFTEGLPLVILLNRAGGYRRAIVQTHNLQFRAIAYESAEPAAPDEPPPEFDADGDCGVEGAPGSGETIDYALIAFQWVEANLLALNGRCNDAIAEGHTTMLIPGSDLPHPDSWLAVCDELTRSGFACADVQGTGISVTLPK